MFNDESSLASFKDESELIDEDQDAKAERAMIDGLKRHQY